MKKNLGSMLLFLAAVSALKWFDKYFDPQRAEADALQPLSSRSYRVQRRYSSNSSGFPMYAN